MHGWALGGGCELALSCDLIVADATAVFGLPETSVGLVPGGGGTQLAARRLGLGRANDLVLTGRRVHAPEAERIGLADRLGWAWRRRWRSRTPPGMRRHSRRTGVKVSRPSIRSGPRSGREREPREMSTYG